jgi:putative methyltransferase (TIGR04325 family)
MNPSLNLNPGLKKMIKLFVPPVLILAAKRLFAAVSRRKPAWEYVPEGWQAAQTDPAIKGWNVQSVLDAYISRWPDFVEKLKGTSPFGFSPESDGRQRTDLSFHNVIMSYSYALSRAAWRKPRITLLDWGGGIGHYYLLSQALLPDLSIDYTCKDLPLLAEHGQKLFPEAHFTASDDCLNRQYDFVLVSSSLQYAERWQDTLTRLAAATVGYLFVTRLPVIHRLPSYVVVQRPYGFGYNTEYLGWCINRSELLACARAAGLELVREFVIEAPPSIHRAPEPCDYWGFLFSKEAG